jgi:hypothetical protein
MAPPLATQYQKIVRKTGSYTLDPSDDVARFVIAAPATATLPLAKSCSVYAQRNKKIVINDSTSSSVLTLAVQSGNTFAGATAAAAAATLAAGETAFVDGDGVAIWNISGGYSGVTGTSGFSGFSGRSGFSGASGYSGYSGTSGTSGYSGKSAYSGVSGISGYSGVSGYSGFSGVSGYSGFSGYSGYTGV